MGAWADLLTGSPEWLRCPQSPYPPTAPTPRPRPRPGYPKAAGQSPGAPAWSHHARWPTPWPPPPRPWTAAVPWAAWQRPPLASQPGGGTSLGNPGPVRAPPSPQEVGGLRHFHTSPRTGAPQALSLSPTASASGFRCSATDISSQLPRIILLSRAPSPTCPSVQTASAQHPTVQSSRVCSFLCLFLYLLLLEKKQTKHTRTHTHTTTNKQTKPTRSLRL